MPEPTEGPSHDELAEVVAAAMHAINADDPGNYGPIIPPTAIPWMARLIAARAEAVVAAAVEKERARCRKIVKRQLTSAFASDVMHRQAIVAAIESGDTDE